MNKYRSSILALALLGTGVRRLGRRTTLGIDALLALRPLDLLGADQACLQQLRLQGIGHTFIAPWFRCRPGGGSL